MSGALHGGRAGVRALAALVAATAVCAAPLAKADAPTPPSTGKAAAKPMQSAPMKTTGSGVAVRYRIDGTPEAGRALPVVLSFDGVTDPAGASVQLKAEGGLSISGDLGHALPAGQTTTITVQVVPPGEGIAYLHVFTSQNGATSATSIPVQVGKVPAALQPSGELKTSPGGDKIRPMPVR